MNPNPMHPHQMNPNPTLSMSFTIEYLRSRVACVSVVVLLFSLAQLILNIINYNGNLSIPAIVFSAVLILAALLCIAGSKMEDVGKSTIVLMMGAVLLFIMAILYAVAAILVIVSATTSTTFSILVVIIAVAIYVVTIITMIRAALYSLELRKMLQMQRDMSAQIYQQAGRPVGHF